MASEPTSPLSPLAEYPPRYPKLESSQQSQLGRPQEFYGFVAWISTSIAWILFLLWALLPDSWIRATGLEWYPSREWALLLPAYSVFLVLFTYFTYLSMAIAATPSFSELKAVTDSFAHIPSADRDNPYLGDMLSPNSVPEIYDLPLGFVNKVMLGRRPRPKRK
ncbi:hypothetical protein FRC03_001063 [Tulasnella sp. 419]|nr:hypothetical protein FRC03_001063 [Tulasnella sp. 419]